MIVFTHGFTHGFRSPCVTTVLRIIKGVRIPHGVPFGKKPAILVIAGFSCIHAGLLLFLRVQR